MSATDRQLGRAVDKAVAEVNAAYLADDAAQEEDRLTGERWRRWIAAEDAAGPHAVVVPVALARDLLSVLRDEDTSLPKDLLISMLAWRVDHLPTE